MKKYSLILLCFGLSAYAMATPEEIPVKNGMSFKQANAELRRSGWHVRAVHTKDGYEYSGTETTMKDHGVKGVESCAMDRPVCIVHYAKRNMCLRIITWGEEFKGLTIDNWDRECPSADVL
jgi:hypothetical protein